LAAALLGAAALAACASPVVYGPANAGAAYGYQDQKIESGRYRLSYKGRDAADAEAGALRRAAELTLAEGATWFRVVTRDLEVDSRGAGGPRIGVGGSVGSGGGRSGSSVGVGVSLPVGGARKEGTLRLEILTGEGAKPADPEVYDAADVLANLGR
jgi:hypothetical protein